MAITVHLYYTGKGENAKKFAEEMVKSGIVARIRQEPGNLQYHYFLSLDDPQTVLLVDAWEDQAAIDRHHHSPMMAELAALRDKYDLHMKVQRFVSEEAGLSAADQKFLRT